MLALHAALVKGFFAEEGLSVQGMSAEVRTAVEQGKPHELWVKTDKGLTEADFGYLQIELLHHMGAGKVDYYVVDGMNFGCQELMVAARFPHEVPSRPQGENGRARSDVGGPRPLARRPRVPQRGAEGRRP